MNGLWVIILFMVICCVGVGLLIWDKETQNKNKNITKWDIDKEA